MDAVTVVGAGRIGLPLVGALHRGGHEVTVVDTRAELSASVSAAGGRWAGTAVGQVRSGEVLLTVLPGSPELRALMIGPPGDIGLLDRMPAGVRWIDLTSAAPDLAAELASRAAERAVRYLDAGIGGGPAQAAQGELTLYIGGEAADVDAVADVLTAIASPDGVHHIGNHGAGYLTKLLVNQLWFGQAVAVGEVLLLARQAGLSPARLAEVLPSSAADSAFVRTYLPLALAGDDVADFGLARTVEELDSLSRAATYAATPWLVSEQVADLYRRALLHFGDRDGELLGLRYLEYLAGRPADDG